MPSAQSNLADLRAALDAEPLVTSGPQDEFTDASRLLAHLQSYRPIGSRWVFRGQKRASWGLAPSIERLGADTLIDQARHEELLGRAFRRCAHHYLASPPHEEDELEWLALMQHHGAPTRLLDWTKSPLVAAFFAVADAEPDQPSAIWAIDASSLKVAAVSVIRDVHPGIEVLPETRLGARGTFAEIFMERDGRHVPAVAPVEPLRANERSTIQQGLFLCPGTLSLPFEVSLKHTLQRSRHAQGLGPHEDDLHKLVVGPRIRNELLLRLHQMNIGYATLFPGLDGFARSLCTHLEMVADDPLDVLMGEEFGRVF
jgi:FRG domain